MGTAEIVQDEPGAARDVAAAAGEGIPSPDEVFEMFEKGKFDGPNPLAVAEDAAVETAEPEAAGAEADIEEPLVAESDVTTWEQRVARSVRAAGRKATWRGRRGMRERTFADRERPGFIGRYAGKAAVTPQFLESEYGTPNPNALLH